jgi:hypothetical protein
MSRKNEFTDRLIIKNATFRIRDCIFFIAALIILYFILKEEKHIFLKILVFGFIGFFTFRIFKRIKDRTDKIIIDKTGIKLCDSNVFINWSKFKFALIRTKNEGLGNNIDIVNYFHIETIEGEIAIKMTDLKYNKLQLLEAIDYFSGIKIGESDRIRLKAIKEKDKKGYELRLAVSIFIIILLTLIVIISKL